MSDIMDPLAVHESCLGFAASSRHGDDFSWLALETVIDEWPGWLTPVNSDHDDAGGPSTPNTTTLPAASSCSGLTGHPGHSSIDVDTVHVSSNGEQGREEASNTSLPTASKGEKKLGSRELTTVLRSWLERHQAPYVSLDEKKAIAAALSISVARVTNFCNNFRKRYVKVGAKLTSYRELVSIRQ